MGDPNITFNPEDIKLRLVTGRRMKVHIDFKKDEAQAYLNFEKMFKPDGLTDIEFAKAVFLAGISTIQKEVMEAAEEHARQEAEKAKAEQDTPQEETVAATEDND